MKFRLSLIIAIMLGLSSANAFAADYAYLWGVCTGWNDYPRTCTLASSATRNSRGGAMTLTTEGGGRYTVRIGNFAGVLGVPLAHSYGGDNYDAHGVYLPASCQLSGTPETSGADLLVHLACYTNAGNPYPNGGLDFLFFNEDPTTASLPVGTAYLWSDNPTPSDPSYAPALQYTSRHPDNRSGITIRRARRGLYAVTIPGMPDATTVPTVTPVGASGVVRCEPTDFGPAGGVDGLVLVECTNEAGAPVDAQFVLTAHAGGPPLSGSSGGFAGIGLVVDNGAVSPTRSWATGNFDASQVTMLETEPGLYTVTIPNTMSLATTFHVSAQRADLGGYCSVYNWTVYDANAGNLANNAVVQVYCAIPGAQRVHAPSFTLLGQRTSLVYNGLTD